MLRLPSTGRVAMMVVVVALVATACGGTEGTTGGAVGKGSLTGAGATFPGPFYQKAFADYSAQHPEVTVNYQSVGSGAGIQQFIKKTVDFGASDVPMKGADITAAGGADALTQIPTGVGASGNQAVAQAISSTDGAVGYVELAYVVQTGMKQAALKNPNGKFVPASVEGATAAAGTNTSVSPSNFSITNAACDACYPIAGFSWVMLYTSYGDKDKGTAVVNLFKWLVTDGQANGKDLQYAPLPDAVQQLALTNLKLIKAGGSAVLT